MTDILSDLRAVYAELFPHRNVAHWVPGDEILVLGTWLKGELKKRPALTILPPAYAKDYTPPRTAKPRGRK